MSINVFSFFTREDCKKVVEAIKNESDFRVERIYRKHKFELRSSRASCDWRNGITKEGDYIVLYNFCNSYDGYGGPLHREDLDKNFNDVDNAIKWIDNFLKSMNIKGYKSLDNIGEQLTLF